MKVTEHWVPLRIASSGVIVEKLAVKVSAIELVWAKLIKCTIYSPAYGEVAFSARLFDQFMLRAIPEFEH